MGTVESRFVDHPVAVFVDRGFSWCGRHLHGGYDFVLARAETGSFFVARFDASRAGSDVHCSRRSCVAVLRRARLAFSAEGSAEASACSSASHATSAAEASAASRAADSTVTSACSARGLATSAVFAAQHEQAH